MNGVELDLHQARKAKNYFILSASSSCFLASMIPEEKKRVKIFMETYKNYQDEVSGITHWLKLLVPKKR